MTEAEIQRCLATTLFHYRRHVCVPNVDFGFLPWEADLVVLRASGYADEVEIKISVADLRRDKHKSRHRWPRVGKALRIRQMYYAVPEDILLKIRADDLPRDAGIIAIRLIDEQLQIRRAEIVHPATRRDGARKLTPDEKYILARLGCIRFWTKT